MWKLVCPPDNWQKARDIVESAVTVLQFVAGSLGLKITVDKEAQRVYMGLPDPKTEYKSSVPSMQRVSFPSGLELEIVDWRLMNTKYAPVHDNAAPLVEWKKRLDAKVGANFKLSEFACHDTTNYGYLRLAPALVELLEKIRAEVGRPLTVVSGYRPPAYNAAIRGAATQSYHIDGLAADIRAAMPYEDLYRIVDRLNPNGGIGRYPAGNWCHADARGSRSRWEGS